MKKPLHISIMLFGLGFFHNIPAPAQWYSTTLLPARFNMAAARVNDKILFAGGYYLTNNIYTPTGSSNRVDIYDVITNQWTTAVLAQPRHSIVAASTGGVAVFAGGLDGLGGRLSTSYADVDIYNSNTNQWTTAKLSETRDNMVVSSAGSKILFAGGTTPYPRYIYSSTVDVYDVTTNQWSVTKLPSLGGPWSSAASIGNKIIFAGSGRADIYDVTTDTWVTESLPTLSFTKPSVTTIANKAFFVGGNNNGLGADGSNIVNIYDAMTSQWSTTQLAVTRSGSGAIAAISTGNKAFFAGGTTSSNLVDIYDEVTNQWTTAQLSITRAATVAANAGNKVFFAGANTKVVDIYDTATNQWSSTQLPQVGVNQTANQNTLLAIGAGERVLFTENNLSSSNSTPIGKVDIYTTNSALPVNLVSFTGKWIENIGNQLDWQTSLETSNDHFQVQRSSDAKSFETIGRVQGKGTTNEWTEYSFMDAAVSDPISYYRLKQVDLNGNAHFSNIISISRQPDKQPAQLSVWPSPTTGELTLELSAGKTIREISVYDLHGRRLSAQNSSRPTTDVSGLRIGAYVLDVLTSDGQHIRSRFVKQ